MSGGGHNSGKGPRDLARIKADRPGRIWRPKIPTEGFTIATSIGRELEYGLQDDEQRFLKWKEEHRHPLWRAALDAAMNNRHEIEKRLALHLGIDMKVWPELGPLNAKERTLIFARVRHMWGLFRECDCPDGRLNIHINNCKPLEPWKNEEA